jgi:hypothetical protein
MVCIGCGGGGGGSSDPVTPTATYDATGTWSTTAIKRYDSDEPETVNEVDEDTITVSQTDTNITVVTGDDFTLSGTVSDATYTFSGDLGLIQAPDGQLGRATMAGTFELTSETSMAGNYTIEWTDESHIHTEQWDFTGTKQDLSSNYALAYAHLMYRNYENADNRYQGVIGINDNGGPIQETDIVTVRMTDSGGSIVNTETEGFYHQTNMLLDCTSGTCTQSGPFDDTGLWGSLSMLAPGTYDIEIDMESGQTLSTSCDYGGRFSLPYVSGNDMLADWNDGDLVLSWDNPDTDSAWSEVDQLRIVVFDNNGDVVLIVKVPPTETTVTIPSALVDQSATLLGGNSLAQWEVQTRAYDTNDMNFARGYSSRMPTEPSTTCGEGLPLIISNLSFPMTVIRDLNYDGSAAYQGSYEDIANPLMFSRISYPGVVITSVIIEAPTVSNCNINFVASIPEDYSGSFTIFFRLIDYDENFSLSDNWDNNAVSNELSQLITIE